MGVCLHTHWDLACTGIRVRVSNLGARDGGGTTFASGIGPMVARAVCVTTGKASGLGTHCQGRPLPSGLLAVGSPISR